MSRYGSMDSDEVELRMLRLLEAATAIPDKEGRLSEERIRIALDVFRAATKSDKEDE